MDNRRDFLKKAALLSGGASIWGMLPDSIQKALEINPVQGSTYLDAEHIVVLMQENRSFDHCLGTLRGVRGYNDPRAITLPNKNLVWLQKNAAGETYAPFRLDIKDTKATWMSALPHSWENQVDARNDGRYDRWLDVKRSGNKEYAPMPLTMGYYNREDVPFYYALADAFTVCDQHFCSSLTGTTPNRLYLWTGTIREKPSIESKANVRNSDVDYDDPAKWITFPERLEDNNISWRIYQNELSLPMGFSGEEEAWLANFTDNPIEWFVQYNVGFSTGFQRFLATQLKTLPGEIAELEQKIKSMPTTGKETEAAQKSLKQKQDGLLLAKRESERGTRENFEKLSQREKNLHQKAFTTNINDPHYHEITTHTYKDGDIERQVSVPKGDVLYQFREDVKTGKLPTVSWVVAPENFSDHPGAPWYGAWYISEIMDILTQNPDVWKKTIFMVTYDENDGYFDHVPPFVAPHPDRTDTGLVSKGIDPSVEHVTMEQENKRKEASPQNKGRAGSIGLGFRVPLLIASPWSRGGYVNSQVFDHTSVLQFMEHFLSHKTNKKIEETNISAWRRTVCGDLTSTFRPYNGEEIKLPTPVVKDSFIQSVHKAKFKKAPSNFKQLSATDIEQINKNPAASPLMPQQEKGIRPSSALPYQLYTEGKLSADRKTFQIQLSAKNEVFGKKAAGSPFNIYAPNKYRTKEGAFENLKAWSYAVTAGDTLTDTWPLQNFENDQYHLRVYGPNGFFREYIGNTNDPQFLAQCEYQRSSPQGKQLTGNVELKLRNLDPKQKLKVEIIDNAYKSGSQTKILDIATHKGSLLSVILDLKASFGWYDFSVKIEGFDTFEQRFAGRVETGKTSFSDPVMGRVDI
ncbi:phosphocholine-specific phospholipase C [Runella sp.]|uniref:phosphocholine-specific phospholipase C n=1 Tax=Runella sp. TaxID=1960881 RepID=UPI003D1331EF